VFYAFYAWWVYFPQLGALAEGTSRPVTHTEEIFQQFSSTMNQVCMMAASGLVLQQFDWIT
jgi:hypothetical protein